MYATTSSCPSRYSTSSTSAPRSRASRASCSRTLTSLCSIGGRPSSVIARLYPRSGPWRRRMLPRASGGAVGLRAPLATPFRSVQHPVERRRTSWPGAVRSNWLLCVWLIASSIGRAPNLLQKIPQDGGAQVYRFQGSSKVGISLFTLNDTLKMFWYRGGTEVREKAPVLRVDSPARRDERDRVLSEFAHEVLTADHSPHPRKIVPEEVVRELVAGSDCRSERRFAVGTQFDLLPQDNDKIAECPLGEPLGKRREGFRSKPARGQPCYHGRRHQMEIQATCRGHGLSVGGEDSLLRLMDWRGI